MDMNAEAAAALQGQPAQGAAPPNPQQGGSLKQFAEAYSRCEQTKSCTPEDRQILEAGLPNLLKMAQNVKAILEATAGGAPQGV